jgi:hypothetical protein
MKTALTAAGIVYMLLSTVETFAAMSAMRKGEFQSEMRWRLRSLESVAMVILFLVGWTILTP